MRRLKSRHISRTERDVANIQFVEAIPGDVMIDILSRVAASSDAHIASIKLSCKGLREIAEDKMVYQNACLDKFPITRWKPLSEAKQKFLEKCLQNNNSELLYREALLDFFSKTELESAYKKLKNAIQLGHKRALYLNSIILLFSKKDNLRREGMTLINKIKKCRVKKGKLRMWRKQLKEELRYVWMNNPVMRGESPVLCEKGHQRKKDKWSGEEIEEEEKTQDHDSCKACDADREVAFFKI